MLIDKLACFFAINLFQVWEVILKKLGPEDLLNLCQTSSQFQYIIEDRLKLNKASLLIEKVICIIYRSTKNIFILFRN